MGPEKIPLENLIFNWDLTIKYNPDSRHPHIYISLFQSVIHLLIIHITHQPVDPGQAFLIYKNLNLAE